MTEPLDEDYLFTFSYEQQRMRSNEWPPYVYDKCPVCRHFWHGVRCNSSGCDCGSSCGVAS